MLSDAEKRAIRETWQVVLPVAETAAELFYRRLAEQNPALRAESHEQLIAQRKEFVTTFSFVVRGVTWEASEWRTETPDDSDPFLALLALGQRGTPLARLFEDHYSTTGETLLWTLTYALGKRFDAKARAAWTRLYTLLANAVRLGRLANVDGAQRVEADPSTTAVAQPARRTAHKSVPTHKPTPIARVRRGASS